MSKVNVGIVGVGNCASSLVQGVFHYAADAGRAGLNQPVCAGFSIADVVFTTAFDVNADKVGRDLSAAIWTAPNNALRFAEVPELGVVVLDGTLADGVGRSCADRFDVAGRSTIEDVAAALTSSETHVLVSFLPVGSQVASERYAQAALLAGCAFINCMPATIARSARWANEFERARLPLVGDDLKSQFGATLVHHALLEVLMRNGVRIRNTHQIVSGGNMDFLNLQDAERLQSKKETKVHGFGGTELAGDRVHFGAEYVPFLQDRKLAYIGVQAEAFGGTPFDLELRMSVEDSPSAAGNVLDAIRYCKFALERGIAGVLHPVASMLMKAPPKSMKEDTARSALWAMLGWKSASS